MSQKQDANQTAARVVAESTEKHEKPLPADLEEAWASGPRGSRRWTSGG